MKGGAQGFLKVCIPGCSDGFARMDNAMKIQPPIAQSLGRPLAIPLAKPLTVPPFLAGTGVAYNEA